MKYFIFKTNTKQGESHGKNNFLSMHSTYYSYMGLLNEINLKSVNSNKP